MLTQDHQNVLSQPLPQAADPVRLDRLLTRVWPGLLKVSAAMFGAGAAVSLLIVMQTALIGTADRLGVSPKWSILGTSFLYALGLGALAVLGGRGLHGFRFGIRRKQCGPICKILIIKQLGEDERL